MYTIYFLYRREQMGKVPFHYILKRGISYTIELVTDQWKVVLIMNRTDSQ